MARSFRPRFCQSPSQGGLCRALSLADTVARTVDRRSPEAVALAGWTDERRGTLSIGEGPDFNDGLVSRPAVSDPSWRRLKRAFGHSLRTYRAPPAPAPAAAWIAALAPMIGLNPLDCTLLELVLLYKSDDRVETLVDVISRSRGGPSTLRLDAGLLALLLGAPAAELAQRLLPSAVLRASGLLKLEYSGCLVVSSRLIRLVDGGAPPDVDPLGRLLGNLAEPLLPWTAFSHLGEPAVIAERVLRAAVFGGAAGVNILLYGPPGTGKTSFAATLAHQADATLRPVTERDDADGEPDRHERLSGLLLAQRLSPRGGALLFDEAEDLFVPRSDHDGNTVTSSRVFMHRLLERNRVPVIWTANNIGALGPAVLRRMTMCLELRIPSVPVRTQLWRSLALAEGLALSEADARGLARLVPAAPAVAATALRATRLAGGDADTARTIVTGIARAVAGGVPTPVPAAIGEYDIGLVNADADLRSLIGRLTRPDAPRAVSFLLSGPPGTGKSALARHMAERMGLEVMHKRASDLLGSYVGETERAIAEAFAEAREAGAFLIFDEADSLLGDRAGAHRGWEVSQVNEMLTWMEQHTLPFACTTNLPERLDPASLRRFLVKLRLDWLTAVQARAAWKVFFGGEAPAGLEELRTLTVADFSLVKRHEAIRSPLTTGEALRALASEAANRREDGGPIGFQRALGK